MPALVELSLKPEAASAGAARHAVTEALRSAGAPDEWVETTALLVTEVVTNAVLHAGTSVRVRCHVDLRGVCVEVADDSAVVPNKSAHPDNASTGRGMLLVEALATESGVEIVDGGKVIWFVVGDRVGEHVHARDTAAPTYRVRFVDLHVAMVRAALAYGEAVLRELALRTLSGTSDLDERWQPPRFSLGPLLEALELAAQAGETVTTIDVEFPTEARELALERLALVEEGHQLAREGKLLAVAAIPEVMHCRRWVYRQIHQQADGAEPERWELPDDLSEVDVVLSASDRAALEATGAVIAADDNNRILFINAAAEALLGTGSQRLVGRRLTAVIPADWRLAHLAGFARFKLTGESRIIGSSTTVPALRSDGTTTTVNLRIEPVAVTQGRVFRAHLQPAEDETGR